MRAHAGERGIQRGGEEERRSSGAIGLQGWRRESALGWREGGSNGGMQ
jgi:hypothetical protein